MTLLLMDTSSLLSTISRPLRRSLLNLVWSSRARGQWRDHGWTASSGSTTFDKTSPAATPNGQGRLELVKFHHPRAVSAEPKNEPVNTLGIRRIMFAVEDIDHVLARLRAHGAELVGELEQYENQYRLCYVRGPEGIIVAFAEPLN
jgi:catechol 2,3-dioxygenase-like lactoylglutathione lyase family enzyme